MPLVTSEKMLKDAREGGYAVAAFNIENMEMVKAIVAGAEELNAPVILQVSQSTSKYGSLETYVALVAVEAAKTSIPVALHLDHGTSFEIAEAAINAGFTAVMIDGSKLSYEENLDLTKRVVDLAKTKGVVVEGELGKVGGKEGDVITDEDTNTDPAQAKEFVEKTGVDSLAVAIGTSHGFYVGTPVLDKERVAQLKEATEAPLVMHGASGLSEEDVRDCASRGIAKVNFATELRVAYTDAMRKLLSENPEIYDPKKPGKAGMDAVKEIVKSRIIMCGSENKAK